MPHSWIVWRHFLKGRLLSLCNSSLCQVDTQNQPVQLTKAHQICLLPYVCMCVLCFRDLRGNKFECDCKAKWLYLWLKMTNSTVSDVLCIGPPEYQEKKLNEVTSFDYECTTTGRQSLRPQRWAYRTTLCLPCRLSAADEGK
jgi:hypothetical protein